MAGLQSTSEIYYLRIQRRWPVILFAGFVGGLIGLLLGMAQPPRYEATAAVRIAIDYSRTHPLDESSERQVLNRVLDMILSDETLRRTVELIPQSIQAEAGISTNADVREVIRLRDLRGRWELIATASSPVIASALANAWAASTLEIAEISLEHAWRASDLQYQLYGLGCALKEIPGASDDALWVCERANKENQAEKLLDSLLREADLSQGLIPALSVSLIESAVNPPEPEPHAEAVYVLAGTLSGLITGTLVVALGGPLEQPEREPGVG